MNRIQLRLLFLLCVTSLALGWAGCASVSPYNQSFIQVRTAHFDIVSSFDESETEELARRLEFFHAGAIWALRLDDPETPFEKTRVFAFDDRSLLRPFAIRGEDAFYLPAAESGIIVLRTDPEWTAGIAAEVQHRYSHRLIRGLAPNRRALWLEEGQAQFASTIEIRGSDVRIGAPVGAHALSMRDWSRSDYADLMGIRDLSGYTKAARADFEARSWALVHMLDAAREQGGPGPFQRYLRALDAGTPDRSVLATLGIRSEDLADQVNDYVRQKQFPARRVQPAGWDTRTLEKTRLSRARSRVELAELALALGRNEVAADYFARALEDSRDYPDALSGLALTQSGPFEDREETARRALDASSALDQRVFARLGDFYALGASEAGLAEAERARRLEEARTFYKRSLEFDGPGIEARLGIARTFLLDDQDGEAALRWISSAKQLRPGALVIDLERARVQAHLGRRTNARRESIDVLSRTHSKRLRDKARELLAELSGSPAP